MKRSEEARVRLEGVLGIMRGHINQLERSLASPDEELGQEASQSIVMTAFSVSTLIAQHDAFMRMEKDDAKK